MNVRIAQRSTFADAVEMHVCTRAQSILTVAGRPAELPSYAYALEVLEAANMAEHITTAPEPTRDGKFPKLRSI